MSFIKEHIVYRQGFAVPGTQAGLLRYMSGRQIPSTGGLAPGTLKKGQPWTFSHQELFPAFTERVIHGVWYHGGGSSAHGRSPICLTCVRTVTTRRALFSKSGTYISFPTPMWCLQKISFGSLNNWTLYLNLALTTLMVGITNLRRLVTFLDITSMAETLTAHWMSWA